MEFPQAFLDQMRALLGAAYPDFLTAMQRPAGAALRLNPARPCQPAMETEGAVPWESMGRYIAPDCARRPSGDLAHFAGGYYMQDASAMAPVAALNPRPGERVLDLCAAPGGKAGQIAARLDGKGVLVANEVDFTRARGALSGNLERLGVGCAAVVTAMPDALAALWPDCFDAVLVDAPCSGEGMFRRDPGALRQWNPGAPRGCAQRQAGVLAAAARMVRPGGRLAYSTCTFNDLENEGVIGDFLRTHPDFAPRDFALEGVGSSRDGMLRLWPHRLRGEGHFVALLGRRGESAPALEGLSGEGVEPSARRAWDALRAALPGCWSERLTGWRIGMQGDLLRALPPGMPALPPSVHRAGLHLARIRADGRALPDHALAMWLAPGETERVFEMDDAQAWRYLAGECLDSSIGDGWAPAVWRSMALGFGKSAGGQFKNHLPKGLRKI